MAILSELSSVVKQRRAEIGLSQGRLAELAGLSRATINELESGKLSNLSLNRAERLANTLGFSIGVSGASDVARRRGNALELAARAASVSYKRPLTSSLLEEALTTGVVPSGYMPHLRALLDEVPLSVLGDVAVELEREHRIPRTSTWQRMRVLALQLACTRGIWN